MSSISSDMEVVSCLTCPASHEVVSEYRDGWIKALLWKETPKGFLCWECSLRRLASIVSDIRDNDTNYTVRAYLVCEGVAEALRRGLQAGFRIDPDEPEWPVAFIELPTGQVSWHMPQHPNAWDGHSNQEKFQRIEQFLLLSQE